MQPQLRAIFFDFDGVLIDSVSTKTEAFRTLFMDYPEDIIEKVLFHHQQHGGISRVEKIAHAHAHYIGVPLTEDVLQQWANHYSELVVEKVIEEKWIAGAEEFLLSMRGSEIKSFVISGTPEVELQYILQKRGMSDSFHEQLGSPVRKPDHIKMLLDTYHLDPSECVFVGDAYTDYDAAKETGLHFIGIQGDVVFEKGTIVLKDCCNLQDAIDSLFSLNKSE
ncbi:HAD family hydrolase [Desulforhopalus sp. 52FAK]